MGEALHEIVRERRGTRCRIYAPVGAHRDLLAYLVRRLLENGANSSFVNQIVDKDLAPEAIAARPASTRSPKLGDGDRQPRHRARRATSSRRGCNAAGWNVNEPASIAPLIAAREAWRDHRWTAAPDAAVPGRGRAGAAGAQPGRSARRRRRRRRGDPGRGRRGARRGAGRAFPPGRRARRPSAPRSLRRAADLYEANAAELIALATREAGKTLADAIAELREAVDFLRYYADAAEAATGRGSGA